MHCFYLSAIQNQGHDTDITEVGLHQANITIDYLVKRFEGYDGTINVYCSDLKRTKYMANSFVKKYPGKCVSVLNQVIMNEYYKRGEEKPTDFIDRLRLFIKENIEKNKKKKKCVYLFFGHSLYISLILTHLIHMNRGEEKVDCIKNNMIDIDFELPNCSISTVSNKYNKWRVLGIGNNGHLYRRKIIEEDLRTGCHCKF
jgi:broad specificity phosphatase PhoE